VFSLLQFPVQLLAQKSDPINKSKTASEKRLVYDLFDKLFTPEEEIAIKPSKSIINLDNKVQIFGSHSSRQGDSYMNYDYSVLTTVSYFSCNMALENGQLIYQDNDLYTLEAERITQLADQDSCNSLLTFRCDNKNVIRALLSDQEEINYCVKYISDLVTSRPNVEGLNISFVNIPNGYKAQFSELVMKMKKSLDVFDKSLVLSLPATPDNRKYDIKALNEYSDQFVMMGYNYYYSGGKKAGPVSPLFSGDLWGELNLQNSVNHYLTLGVPKNKFIVSLPYYGAVWKIDTLNNKINYRFVQNKAISAIWDHLEKTGIEAELDPDSQTKFYHYIEGGNLYICYFDDHTTLKTKFQWIQAQGVAGIGVRALGFDDGSNELWNMLSKNFVTLKNPDFQEIVNYSSYPDSLLMINPDAFGTNVTNLFSQYEIQVVIGFTVIGFVVLGFILALTSSSIFAMLCIYDIRKYLKIAGIYAGFLLLQILICEFVFHSRDYLEKRSLKGLISSDDIQGLLVKIGIIGFVIISAFSWKAFLTINKDLP
jgi:spore germination protein YaaH